VGKSYNPNAKDYVIGLKIVSPELDYLKAYYENASISGVLDESRWSRWGDSYSTEFLSGREIGEHRIKLEVGKDGGKVEKDFSINIGLSEEEISSSSLPRKDLKLLWRDLLKDVYIKLDREELFKIEYDMVNAAEMNKISEPASTYLKSLANSFLSSGDDHKKFLKGTSLFLHAIDSRPWICYGNFTKDVDKAEFPLREEDLYLLVRFLSEVDVDEEHIYAARATIEQLKMVSLWLEVQPFEVLEYEGERLQLWDLAKKLFEKQLKYEQNGMRASMRDLDLVRRWSLREETNNKHIYYGLRQVQLPAAVFIYDIEKMGYAFEHYGVPVMLPGGSVPKEKSVNLLEKFVNRYDELIELLNEIVNNPDKKLKSPFSGARKSPKEFIEWYLSKTSKWGMKYFPNSQNEANEDYLQTLFFSGSPESRTPIIMYGVSNIWNTGHEEGRVEGNILLSSYLGYPAYRFGLYYPGNTDKRSHIHGEFSFILNKEDENLLYKRSKDELFVEKTHTYSLPFKWTRRNAILKDQEERGKIEGAIIILPLLHSTPVGNDAFIYYKFPIS